MQRAKREKIAARKREAAKERLTAAALIRNGDMIERGFRSHYQLRQALGDANPQTSNLNDTEGFVTSTGRFVTRDEAREIAVECGQIDPRWMDATRPLLSSDIDW